MSRRHPHSPRGRRGVRLPAGPCGAVPHRPTMTDDATTDDVPAYDAGLIDPTEHAQRFRDQLGPTPSGHPENVRLRLAAENATAVRQATVLEQVGQMLDAVYRADTAAHVRTQGTVRDAHIRVEAAREWYEEYAAALKRLAAAETGMGE